jgi:hypothetical protein
VAGDQACGPAARRPDRQPHDRLGRKRASSAVCHRQRGETSSALWDREWAASEAISVVPAKAGTRGVGPVLASGASEPVGHRGREQLADKPRERWRPPGQAIMASTPAWRCRSGSCSSSYSAGPHRRPSSRSPNLRLRLRARHAIARCPSCKAALALAQTPGSRELSASPAATSRPELPSPRRPQAPVRAGPGRWEF